VGAGVGGVGDGFTDGSAACAGGGSALPPLHPARSKGISTTTAHVMRILLQPAIIIHSFNLVVSAKALTGVDGGDILYLVMKMAKYSLV
jgi:hypothetical protein